MTFNLEDSRIDLITKIDQMIDAKLPSEESVMVKDFVAQYYLGVSPYDLREKSIGDLYGALISLWRFLYNRLPGESKVRVYNPRLEESGWQSNHTVIEIVHDNKPFILDSIRLALNRIEVNTRLIIHAEGVCFERDKEGNITKVLPLDYKGTIDPKDTVKAEAPIYIEIDRQSDAALLEKITLSIQEVLSVVDVIVLDWKKMTSVLNTTIDELEKNNTIKDPDVIEIIQFLQWLGNDHFTFIGYAEYKFIPSDNSGVLDYTKGSGLGVLTETRLKMPSRDLDNLYPAARDEILSDEVMLLGKTDSKSTVHRPAYTDFVCIKFFDKNNKLNKMVRFLGLYTASVYNEPAMNIPFIRQKIERIFNMTKFTQNSHDGKVLLNIIETLPRDELFQANENELFDLSIGVLHLQERQRIRIFIRRDTYGRFFSCLVYVPREIFSSQLRTKMQDILMRDLQGENVTFDTKFSESVLARIQFIIRVSPSREIKYDQPAIEQQLIEAARNWSDDLYEALNEHCGEEKANELYKTFSTAFPGSYQEIFSAHSAVMDIEHIENLKNYDDNHLEMSLYRLIEDPDDSFRFKLFRNNKTIPLSDIVPILEHMGLRIISERPHEIKLKGNGTVWINDYRMIHPKGEHLSPEVVKVIFQETFDSVWHGLAENDRFNRLVLGAELNWRDISVLRGLYRYMWQTGLTFSQNYVEDALSNNSIIAKKLMQYFYVKFDIEQDALDRPSTLTEIRKEILNELESVTSLNEDRIIRNYLGTLEAMMRTNYFQRNDKSELKASISFKFDSAKVPDLPLPKPVCEIFVYSPEIEGVHLRGDKVARGGIRWSERREDFRTEVLGLMKAQQVKNAVIVPLGAKGGFVVKRDLSLIAEREKKQNFVITCYQTFIRGLLDLTDNYQGVQVIKPIDTVCWDKDDPYLVVAADKGTATFSDIANDISKQYNFWLGDAFASGGSSGYDHKKMAITARGAWESVKMHFQHLGVDLQTETITVLGIGDMAGDVFGNGMLLSRNIKLIAAFNHMHIFFDPEPDPERSFNERQRLFNLPHSAWSDYNPDLISHGGGVFLRSAKKITLSPEMQKWLNTQESEMQPNDLIRSILMMQVDLFFNGGIGTFVKAASERNTDVGDRANDAIRINGFQLNCRVVCEGGNLGFTQLGRIEYAKKGGLINTDAIDNSAGVNCSDNEVNIKILLDAMIDAEDLTEKQRNDLLESMTDEVAELVLANNIKQNEALTIADYQSPDNLQMHYRLLKRLEKSAGLDPVVEFLPSQDEINMRIAAKQGFTRPELAILMAYTKIQLKKQLLASTVPDEPYAERELIDYFPRKLRAPEYSPYMKRHRLRRAIIATQISNYIVDEMGINFIQRLEEESGAESPDIACAYMIAREVFELHDLSESIRSLGVSVSMNIQLGMQQDLNRLLRRATRWFLQNRHGKIQIEESIKQFKPKIKEVQLHIDEVLRGAWLEQAKTEFEHLRGAGVPKELADIASKFTAMFTALDIVEAAIENDYDIVEVAKVYFAIGARLQLGWFGEMIKKQPVSNYWEALARAAFRDDVDRQQRDLAVSILNSTQTTDPHGEDIEKRVETWLSQHQELLQRWEFFLVELKTTVVPSFTMFAVALRELLDLAEEINYMGSSSNNLYDSNK